MLAAPAHGPSTLAHPLCAHSQLVSLGLSVPAWEPSLLAATPASRRAGQQCWGVDTHRPTSEGSLGVKTQLHLPAGQLRAHALPCLQEFCGRTKPQLATGAQLAPVLSTHLSISFLFRSPFNPGLFRRSGLTSHIHCPNLKASSQSRPPSFCEHCCVLRPSGSSLWVSVHPSDYVIPRDTAWEVFFNRPK